MIPKKITIHCSATRVNQDIGVEEIKAMHLARGWRREGYHFIVRRNGVIETGRPLTMQGAGVSGNNKDNVHICWIGGVDAKGKGEDNRTDEQKTALLKLVSELCLDHEIEDIRGHRDYSPDLDGDGEIEPHEWLKLCPCYNAIEEYGHLTCY